MARILKDWLNSYMEYTEQTEPAESFRLWAGIMAITAALERDVFLNWDKGQLYCNQYCVLVAKAGGRKGFAIGPMKRIVREVGLNIAANSTTRESIIQELSSINEVPKKAMNSFEWKSDAALTIISEEWSVFTGYRNNELMSMLCDLYDCPDEWSYKTKNSGQFTIPNVWLSMFAGTTPQLLLSALPPDAIGGGLSSRTIYISEPGKGKVVVLPLETAAERELREKLVHDLREIRQMAGPFKYTDEFLHVYVPWRLAYEKDPPFQNTVLESYVNRRTSHFMKLSMIMSASRSNDMNLMKVDAERAIKILTATEGKMKNAFRGVGRSNTADVLAHVMQTVAAKGKTSFRELMKLYWQDVDDPKQLNAMVQTMVQMGMVTVTSSPEDIYITFISEE